MLKRTHKYYSQIQTQMFVCGKKNAFFGIQTPSGITVEKIPFDEEYFNEMLNKVVTNYCSVFIPEYFEHRMLRRLPVIHM